MTPVHMNLSQMHLQPVTRGYNRSEHYMGDMQQLHIARLLYCE